MKTSLILAFILCIGHLAFAGGNSGSGGTRPTVFALESPDVSIERVKAIATDRGEFTFVYRPAGNFRIQTLKMRAEEFSADQGKYLDAVKKSLATQEWVSVN